MVAVMLKAVPSFFQKFSETSLFKSTDDYEKFLVCRDYCVAAHDPAFSFWKTANFTFFSLQTKIWMIYSSNSTVFVSHINTLIASTLSSSSDSAATFWRKTENYSTVWKEPFRSPNSKNEWISCPALQKSDYSERSSKNTGWHQFKSQFQFKQTDQFLWRESRVWEEKQILNWS